MASLAGCYGRGSFVCESNDQCSVSGIDGICQPNHACSFADGTCTSGQRYGDSAGTSSGACVGDTPIDASTPSEGPVDGQECFGGPLRVCRHPPPDQTLALPATIDTDDDCQFTFDQTATGGPTLCGFAATTITIDDTVATGSRGLLLVASDSITITGTLDISSTRNGATGAGADSPACTTAGPGGQDNGGGSGGAGGSFLGKGGDGGEGDQNDSGPPAGSRPGGKAGDVQAFVFVRGGCPGAKGGDGTGGNHGGGASHGGGAVYLIAGNTISIASNGAVFASGSAGLAADPESGGGGGGSGGLIGFDAMTLTIDGTVAANGGAGGGGGSGGGMGQSGAGGNGGDGHDDEL